MASALVVGWVARTEAQSTRAPGGGGQPDAVPVYTQHCAACHGGQLQGGAGPALIAPDMGDRDPKELAAVIKSTMPLGAPGSLSDRDYDALARYIIARNSTATLPH